MIRHQFSLCGRSLCNALLTTLLSGLLPLTITAQAQAGWILGRKVSLGKNGSTLTAETLSIVPTAQETDQARVLRSIPFYLVEDGPSSDEIYEEVLVPTHEVSSDLSKSFIHARNATGTEMRKIVEQGPATNRICLTILGDGYTEAEREKFFADAKRTADGLFTGNTFASYLPLFNIYAVFVPSRDSGITDIARKNTAFGLYRNPPGSKRAIMPGNTMAMEAALRAAPKTDFPIVLANDEFYGGLGGRYAISTSSARSGLIVLRHELGHNFGSVGEEYDNGSVYQGANSSSNPTNPSWSHWLTSTTDSNSVHEMQLLSGEYAWANLSQGPVRSEFMFPAESPQQGGSWFSAEISGVGWSTPGEVSVLIDGQELPLEGTPTVDRSFYSLKPNRSLAPGRHTIEVRENVHDGDNVLAFAVLFAHEGTYDFTPGKVGAFTTWDERGGRHYRPTHKDCLMRDMLSQRFCPVDQENMWVRFLDRVRLVDDLKLNGLEAQLQSAPLQGLKIKWLQKASNGVESELSSYRNQSRMMAPSAGNYAVEVEFMTPEVRKPTSRFKDRREFRIQ